MFLWSSFEHRDIVGSRIGMGHRVLSPRISSLLFLGVALVVPRRRVTQIRKTTRRI